jgi:hypothetical protein
MRAFAAMERRTVGPAPSPIPYGVELVRADRLAESESYFRPQFPQNQTLAEICDFSPGPTVAIGASYRLIQGTRPFVILTANLSFSDAETHLSGADAASGRFRGRTSPGPTRITIRWARA